MPKKKSVAVQVKEAEDTLKLRELQRLIDAPQAVMESYGSLVDPREAYSWGGAEEYGLPVSLVRRDDYANGRFRPFYEHEQDLQGMWSTARYLANADAAGCGMLRALTDYVIGTGFTYELEGLSGEGVEPLQKFLDEWQERVEWTGELEREIFGTAETYGDAFPWLEAGAESMPKVTILAPEWITEPSDKSCLGEDGWLDWTFGVASMPTRSWEVSAYFASINGNAQDWEKIDKCNLPHIKRNAPRQAKRGVSTFYPAMKLLEKASKLLGNTLEGGAIQAAIAFIREHAPGVTSSQAQNLVTGGATSQTTKPSANGGSMSLYQRRFSPGTVLDVGAGQKYHAGPMGTPAGPLFVEIVQAGLRLAGARLGMPEYMISGDASNANYSSTLVAGSPFVRSIEHLQSIYKSAFHKLMWRVLEIAADRQKLCTHGIYHKRDLKAAAKLTVTPTEVVIGDPKAQEDIRKIRKDSGVLSVKTWQKEVDLDPDEEAANIAQEPKPEPPPMFGDPSQQQGFQRPQFRQRPNPFRESWEREYWSK